MAVGRIGGGVLKDNLERNGSNLKFKNTSGTTALLSLDVVNSRVGINNESPAAGYSLDVPSPLYSTNLLSTNANIQNWTIDTNRIYQNSGDINLSGASNVFLTGLLTDNLRVNFNTFRSLANSNIYLNPNGTGTVEMYSNWNSDGNIHATGNITFGGDLVLGDDDTDTVIFQSDVNSDLLPDVDDVSNLGRQGLSGFGGYSTKRWNQLNVTALSSASARFATDGNPNEIGTSIFTNVIQAKRLDYPSQNVDLNLNHTVNGRKVDINLVLLENGTISTAGQTLGFDVTNELTITSTQALTLPIGTNDLRPSIEGSFRYNSTWNLFEVRSNTGYMPLGGVISDDGLTRISASTNNTLDFQANNLASGSIDSTGVNLTGLQVDDINMNSNLISTTTADTNIQLTPHGTGTINIDNINFSATTITNNSNLALISTPTGFGYDKIAGTNGVVIPLGNTAQRWVSPDMGDTRWNTDSNTLETYNGSSYVGSAGSGGTLTPEEMNELALQYTIILG